MFHALASGRLKVPDTEFEVHLHDVEALNRLSLKGEFDLTKVSVFTYLLARESYTLLNSGAALGFGCGPLVVTRVGRPEVEPSRCRFAVPGELTTAHLLLRLWAPQTGEKVFVRYDRVMPMVAAGEVDYGVVIHEGRFVYRQAGLDLVQDLGEWWERRTGLPVPLGCVLARTSLGPERIAALDAALRRSIEDAIANPAAALDYMRRHALEMDEKVLHQHVQTFVNHYSLDLGVQGRAAVAKLEELARISGALS